jgi:effector-binding domain-containing protein
LELIEKKFRDTPEKHNKYKIRLTEYIKFLIQKEKFLEAKYFFNILYKIKNDHPITIRLGYSLSISLFDTEGVKKFDSLLYQSKAPETELIYFRLKYYYSTNNYKNSAECCEILLSKKLNKEQEQLTTIMEICLNQQSYEIAKSLIKYLSKEKLCLTVQGNKQIKKILIQKLTNTLAAKIKNV